ncbi:hypothetical protein [Rhizobium sp. 768_B6_N1_8]|uniref:hypothetical protein n=1 Tax=unclassified Rhizobium TaxID=2613769 RepID=UPI003F205A96
MDARERKRLNRIAEDMLGEARAIGHARVYSATGFSQQNISIAHQQTRCTNLAWALRRRAKVRKADVVAIVGGAFSGIMLACSLAIADDIIVYVIEKDYRLLNRFLDKSHRFLSQNLNTRDLRKKFDPSFAAPMDRPPIFDWEAGVASDVAGAWMREFDRHASKLPIFTIESCEVKPGAISETNDKVIVQLQSSAEVELRPLVVDLLIDATGFGEEANPLKLADYSYWEGGHRLIYDHLSPESNVLISGCGDSGVIELMHYAFGDFQHEMIKYFWPARQNLEATLDLGLEHINSVIRSEEIVDFEGQVISELCWWLGEWRILRYCKDRRAGLPNPIFTAIEVQLAERISAAFPGRKSESITEDERETFVLSLSLEEQLDLRVAISSTIDDTLSLEIAALVEPVSVANLLNVSEIHKRLRPNVEITMNGLTPTPFTRNMSPYNVWLTHVMMGLPNVHYQRGRIVDTCHISGGKTKVIFADGMSDVYDRVVSRYGPGRREPGKQLCSGALRDPYPGDFLLDYPTYSVSDKNSASIRIARVGNDRIKARLPVVQSRRGSDPKNPIYKQYYIARMLTTEANDWISDPRYKDPQTWLSDAIRKGCFPAYVDRS